MAEQVGGRGGRADDVEDVARVGHDGVVAGPHAFLDERVEFVDGALHEGADHFQEAHVGVETAVGVGGGHAFGPPAPEDLVPGGAQGTRAMTNAETSAKKLPATVITVLAWRIPKDGARVVASFGFAAP